MGRDEAGQAEGLTSTVVGHHPRRGRVDAGAASLLSSLNRREP